MATVNLLLPAAILLAEQELDSRIGRVDEGIRLGDFHVMRDRWM